MSSFEKVENKESPSRWGTERVPTEAAGCCVCVGGTVHGNSSVWQFQFCSRRFLDTPHSMFPGRAASSVAQWFTIRAPGIKS